jgi:hypothetical protein
MRTLSKQDLDTLYLLPAFRATDIAPNLPHGHYYHRLLNLGLDLYRLNRAADWGLEAVYLDEDGHLAFELSFPPALGSPIMRFLRELDDDLARDDLPCTSFAPTCFGAAGPE